MAGLLPGIGRSGACRGSSFANTVARSVNATARINKMGEYIAGISTAEWLERLDAAAFPARRSCAREIIHNEQVVARE